MGGRAGTVKVIVSVNSGAGGNGSNGGGVVGNGSGGNGGNGGGNYSQVPPRLYSKTNSIAN